ncbi:MAG: alpha/beta hydrolase [Anaerolineae bacterium]|jgi:triacylglycerol lipase|nr:alpha/beta hydrolase [Anaerolineae bacterium]MBT7189446.1 alpha/beta hydrolase [Anaerolineae bacterium]MBT7991986.1 alpha/beta hydrolase [Anaerolineae bacterium]
MNLNTQKVILLHGLGRASHSMTYLSNRLQRAGYSSCNVSYPSRKYSVKKLAIGFILPAIEECIESNEPVHFVTHSLGGIIVRQLAALQAPINFGRIVMLAPPNGGSEIANIVQRNVFVSAFNGPAGKELGTSEKALPRSLGPAPFEVGIIAGNRTINPLLSRRIAGENDGRLSVENAKLEGMADFIVLPVSHPLIMLSKKVAEETIHFLEYGRFQRK